MWQPSVKCVKLSQLSNLMNLYLIWSMNEVDRRKNEFLLSCTESSIRLRSHTNWAGQFYRCFAIKWIWCQHSASLFMVDANQLSRYLSQTQCVYVFIILVVCSQNCSPPLFDLVLSAIKKHEFRGNNWISIQKWLYRRIWCCCRVFLVFALDPLNYKL